MLLVASLFVLVLMISLLIISSDFEVVLTVETRFLGVLRFVESGVMSCPLIHCIAWLFLAAATARGLPHMSDVQRSVSPLHWSAMMLEPCFQPSKGKKSVTYLYNDPRPSQGQKESSSGTGSRTRLCPVAHKGATQRLKAGDAGRRSEVEQGIVRYQ